MKKLLFSCLIVSSVFAQEFSPTFDINFTPYAGAENLLSIHEGFEKLENVFFTPNTISLEEWKNPENLSQKGKWSRFARDVLWWLPEGCALAVTQHEIFGHGYRVRDLGPKYCKVKSYEMYVIGGTTEFEATPSFTASQELAVSIAGMEASSILAQQSRMKWLQNGTIDPRQTIVYMLSSLDLTGYALSVDKTPHAAPTSGNDISQYLFFLNALYPSGHLSCRSLSNQALINVLDPFIICSYISSSLYESYGDSSPMLPMINLGFAKYLPGVHFALTPFGPEYYLQNYFVKGGSPTYFYLKYGTHADNDYYGLGIENRNIFAWKHATLGFKLDFWHQPNVLFKQGAVSAIDLFDWPKHKPIPQLYPDDVLTKKHYGCAVSVTGVYDVDHSAHLNLELGYKTKGFLPGEALRQSPILRGGFSLMF